MVKTIAVLGATGSVGSQALSVARAANYKVDLLTASGNTSDMEAYAREFMPRTVVMANENAARELKISLRDTDIKVLSGKEGIIEAIALSSAETVINSIIGEAGLLPTLAVIDSGSRLALANKESLVVAGEIVMARAREKGVEIIPVDSEHSAIFQCLKAGRDKEVKRILLTASGGPFFGRTREELKDIRVEQALAHPTWSMGAKITIDSATLMNKGFEVIEAVHLFGVPAERIQVTVHRESIIHSMVEYIDNSVIAQMSVPDMRLCAQYAVTYPDRCEAVIDQLDLFSIAKLTFAKPDTETFSLLACAIECIGKGGALPAVLNAANEVAVAEFLKGNIGFYTITESVTDVVSSMEYAKDIHDLEGIIQCDREARRRAGERLGL